MTRFWDELQSWEPRERHRALAAACREAVAVWEAHVTERHAWIGGAVPSEHHIEPGLARRALDEIDRRLAGEVVDPAETSSLLWHPMTGLQHDELALPETVRFAIYAVFNLHRLVFENPAPTAQDELIVLNQAIAALLRDQHDDTEIEARLALWWAGVTAS